ncbi:hypothetical protein BSYN_10340 [Bacteroides sedimenti]|uniref:Uncharacterized protein n=1 Tax=Bacteroides sedimenti TaxID=2136147 RepID=A0ABM8I9Q2_9BACE
MPEVSLTLVELPSFSLINIILLEKWWSTLSMTIIEKFVLLFFSTKDLEFFKLPLRMLTILSGH